ncbi:MAG TPA: PAS domain-containing sensor histidine kinase [Candidatus Limnocylindria bacterium]|nr:PAS domain-containing sensor histidine kinase [Candidatus Limnocylindria bacterium]
MTEGERPAVGATGWRPEYLAAIVDSSDDAIIGKTLDGTIISWNVGAQRIYGYTADEAIGRPIAMLVPADHPDEIPQILGRLRRGERVEHYRTTRIRKDGQPISVSVTISPVRDSEGVIVGASAIARDITAQERAVQEALELREQFVSIAAHELRSPMTTFFARLQLAERRLARSDLDRDALRHDIAQAMRGAHRLRLLIDRLLDFTRLSAGRLDIERAPTDLVGSVRTVAEALAEASGRDIVVHAPERSDANHMNVDQVRIEQVIANLIDNAVKYSPDGTPIDVAVEAEDGRVFVAVSDRGPGVPEHERARIFEPFQRASPDTRGVGLGLHVAREIVRLHGGSLRVEDAEGGGARFVMMVPKHVQPSG